MALIELNLEKPALKRSETVGTETDAESDRSTADASPIDGDYESIDLTADDVDDQDEESRGRLRRTGRLFGIVTVGVLGAMTLKKYRNRGETPGDGANSEF